MQQRAPDKYHKQIYGPILVADIPILEKHWLRPQKGYFGEKWAQTVPHFLFKFVYKFDFYNVLSELECDHVYFGFSNVFPPANSLEVEDYKYVGINELRKDPSKNTENYSKWFENCID